MVARPRTHAPDPALDATAPVWEYAVGSVPYKVTALELVTRKRVLYLRWREAGNWRYESLAPAAAAAGFATATLYDDDGARLTGRKLQAKQKWAQEQADAKYAALRSPVAPPEPAPEARPLAVGGTWAAISDPDTGKYPTDTPHRREVKRELEHAVRILGADVLWATIRLAHLTKLWRTRIRELREARPRGNQKRASVHEGLRGAEVTVARFLAIAQWLRDQERIPKDAAIAPRSWKQELRRDWKLITESLEDYQPRRERHSLEEMRKLIAHAGDVDPRFGLLMALGAELRLGQVVRTHRRHLRRELRERGGTTTEGWLFSVPGAGNKGGAIVELTNGQVAAVVNALGTGYLSALEAAFQRGEITDYPLFPAGQLPGGRAHRRGVPSDPEQPPSWRAPETPIATLERHATAAPASETAIRQWFTATEARAKIAHVKGRGPYGVRRVAVDGLKEMKVSREALQAFGGWSDTQVPDQIYADQEMQYARREAAEARAKLRGEEA